MKFNEVENRISEDTYFNVQIAINDLAKIDDNELDELYRVAPTEEYARIDGCNVGIFNNNLIIMGKAGLFVNKNWWKTIKENLEVDDDDFDSTETLTINYFN